MARTSPGRYALTSSRRTSSKWRSPTARASRSTPRGRTCTSGTSPATTARSSSATRSSATAPTAPTSASTRCTRTSTCPRPLMFARGWMDRPGARHVRAARRARRGRSPRSSFPPAIRCVFTAPNLQYLMDSPTEFSNFTLRTFTVDDGGEDRAAADVPRRAPARRHRCRGRRLREGRRAHRPRGVARLRRAAAVRHRHLHVPEPTICPGRTATAWSTATARRSPAGRAAQSRAAPGHPRHRVARVLPLLEHGADPLEGHRAVRLRGGRHERRALARRGLHQLLRRPDPRIAPASSRSTRCWTTSPA